MTTGLYPTNIYVDETTHRLLVSATISSLPTVSSATSTAVTVGSTSTSVLASNSGRKSATLVNDSNETIYLALGASASMNSGIRLNASGGSARVSNYTGAITAICASGSKNLTVVEL